MTKNKSEEPQEVPDSGPAADIEARRKAKENATTQEGVKPDQFDPNAKPT